MDGIFLHFDTAPPNFNISILELVQAALGTTYLDHPSAPKTQEEVENLIEETWGGPEFFDPYQKGKKKPSAARLKTKRRARAFQVLFKTGVVRTVIVSSCPDKPMFATIEVGQGKMIKEKGLVRLEVKLPGLVTKSRRLEGNPLRAADFESKEEFEKYTTQWVGQNNLQETGAASSPKLSDRNPP